MHIKAISAAGHSFYAYCVVEIFRMGAVNCYYFVVCKIFSPSVFLFGRFVTDFVGLRLHFRRKPLFYFVRTYHAKHFRVGIAFKAEFLYYITFGGAGVRKFRVHFFAAKIICGTIRYFYDGRQTAQIGLNFVAAHRSHETYIGTLQNFRHFAFAGAGFFGYDKYAHDVAVYGSVQTAAGDKQVSRPVIGHEKRIIFSRPVDFSFKQLLFGQF